MIPSLQGGGAEKQAVIQMNALSKLDWDIHLILKKKGINFPKLEPKRIKVYILKNRKLINPFLFLEALKLILKIKPNIIVTWLLEMDILGGLISIFLRKNFVATERTSELAYKKTPLRGWLRKIIIKKSSLIISNSKFGKEYLTKNGISNNRIKLVRNIIFPLKKLNPKKEDNNKGNFILCVGRIEENKGVYTSLNAMCKISYNIKLKFIGEGKDKGNLLQIIERKGMGNRISIVDYDENWVLNNKSALGLLSMSCYEGSPNVVLEAMNAEIPTIVSDISAHREVLTEDATFFVPINNEKLLQQTIEKLYQDDLLKYQKVKNAKNCLSDYRFDKNIEKLDFELKGL